MMVLSSRLLFALGLAMSWGMSAADNTSGSAAFRWTWTNNMVSTDMTQCKAYGISIIALATNSSSFGVPPYYMIAWKPNGVPTVSPIGSDRSNLSWTVNQASGSSLILTVADSLGMAGGEAPSLYTVSDGDSGCLPSAPSTNVTLGANISTSNPLETCEPLGLRVYGGQKPYTISLAALNSPVVTNVTLNDNDDVLTWPNLADPNGQLVVSVSDANGTWGTSTGIFKTAGANVTNSTNCGIITTSGNSANVNQHPPQPSKSNTTVIVAVVVPIIIVCLIAGFVFFLWRRRRQNAREPEPAFLPDAWTGPSIMEVGPGGTSPYSPYDPPPSSKFARYRDEPGSSNSRTSSSQFGIGMGHLAPGMPQAARRTGTFEGRSGPGSMGSGSYSNGDSAAGGKGEPRLPPGVSSEWAIEPEVIIQHRDGGAVQEIPPPYLDHSAQTGSSSGPTATNSSNVAGLSATDSSVGTSRPSSAAEPSPRTSGSSTPLYPRPSMSKGKGKETALLE